jgi:type I restriction-modification system DNA methylase subunit
MVELIDKFKEDGITKNDICLDPCAGTGTFLLAFMTRQIEKYRESAEQIKENLFGIEMSPVMYVLSIDSMLISGDGKANLINGNCFDSQKFIQQVKEGNTKVEKIV